jgi:hypothetical protein
MFIEALLIMIGLGDLTNVWGRHQKAMSSPATSVTGLGTNNRRVFRLSAGN